MLLEVTFYFRYRLTLCEIQWIDLCEHVVLFCFRWYKAQTKHLRVLLHVCRSISLLKMTRRTKDVHLIFFGTILIPSYLVFNALSVSESSTCTPHILSFSTVSFSVYENNFLLMPFETFLLALLRKVDTYFRRQQKKWLEKKKHFSLPRALENYISFVRT